MTIQFTNKCSTFVPLFLIYFFRIMYLETKPDYDKCVERVLAWFDGEIIDRAPVRFHRHNAEYDAVIGSSGHATLRQRWMDAEFQAKTFLNSVADDYPIMQHVPYIKHMQSKGASVIVDLDLSDLDKFMQEVAPNGIFLWINASNQEQEETALKKLLKWK